MPLRPRLLLRRRAPRSDQRLGPPLQLSSPAHRLRRSAPGHPSPRTCRQRHDLIQLAPCECRADEGTPMSTMWGIHNDQIPAAELLAGQFVSIGWNEIDDVREIGNDQTALKAALAAANPDAKPG